MSKKVVLGFSGGLDTTFCVKYLSEDKGYEVHSVIVNTGGFTADELQKIEAHALNLGVKTHTTVDAVKGYYDRIIKYLIFGNCLNNNTYPLSVSAERLSQALHIAEHAQKLNADAVAHGSTVAETITRNISVHSRITEALTRPNRWLPSHTPPK